MSYDDWKCTPPDDEPLSICSECGTFDDGDPCPDCEHEREMLADLEQLTEQWPEGVFEPVRAERVLFEEL